MCPEMPRVSVLMSVYNDARFVAEAVDSILSQTFSDFEFIIVDDGSSDATPAILKQYADPRVTVLRNERNVGLTKSLNRGLEATQGEYVARQDADDRSLPHRLAHQVKFLDTHPEICLVGTGFVRVDEEGRELGTVTMPTEPAQIREMLFYAHCFCHGSTMGRRADLQAIGGYDERFVAAQDIDLWLRLAERCQLANLPTVDYAFRTHGASISGQSRPLQREMAHQATAQAVARHLSGRCGWQPSALTLGRFHFSQAIQALEDGRTGCAREQLMRARRENPQLEDDADCLARMAVHQAYELGPSGTSRLKSARDMREGLRFVESLFELLPRGLGSLRGKRRWAKAELHAAYAFATSQTAGGRKTVQHCLAAWRHEPSRLRNRGLISVFARSLTGSRPHGGRS